MKWNGITRHYKYMRYVLRHKWFVFRAGRFLKVPLWRLVIHDWTKFLPGEWRPYADYFYGDEEPVANIPRGALAGIGIFPRSKEDVANDFNLAWNRHQKRNDHHWQWWLLQNNDGPVERIPMRESALLEMLADWKGAGEALGKPDTLAWYAANRGNIQIHRLTRERLEWMLYRDDYETGGHHNFFVEPMDKKAVRR